MFSAAVLAVPSSSKGAATLAPAGAAAGTSVPVTFDRWPDAPALTALYADLLSNDTWVSPTQKLLGDAEAQSVTGPKAINADSYEKWEPGKTWPVSYRQYVGLKAQWGKQTLDVMRSQDSNPLRSINRRCVPFTRMRSPLTSAWRADDHLAADGWDDDAQWAARVEHAP